MKYLNVLFFVLGIGLLVVFINNTGIDEVISYLGKIDYLFVIVLIVAIVSQMFVALGWKEMAYDNTKGLFITFFNASLTGFAINQLTPSGNVGEITKISVIQNHISKKDAVSSTMLFNLLNAYVTILFLIVSIFLMIVLMDTPIEINLLMFISTSVIIFVITMLKLLIRKGVLGILFKIIRFFKIKREWIDKNLEKIQIVDQNVNNFRKDRPKHFWISIIYLIIARILCVVELYLILIMIDYPINFWVIWVVQGASTVLEVIFSFIPGTLGVLEGGSSKIFNLIYLSGTAGFAMELTRRIRKLIFIAAGLIILFPYTFRNHKKQS